MKTEQIKMMDSQNQSRSESEKMKICKDHCSSSIDAKTFNEQFNQQFAEPIHQSEINKRVI